MTTFPPCTHALSYNTPHCAHRPHRSTATARRSRSWTPLSVPHFGLNFCNLTVCLRTSSLKGLQQYTLPIVHARMHVDCVDLVQHARHVSAWLTKVTPNAKVSRNRAKPSVALLPQQVSMRSTMLVIIHLRCKQPQVDDRCAGPRASKQLVISPTEA